MPRAQFRDEVGKLEVTRSIPAPKKVSSIDAWINRTKKVMPEWTSDYELRSTEISLGYIKFELVKPTDERAWIVIDRKAPSIG